MVDDIDRNFGKSNWGAGLVSRYHPARHMDQDVLNTVGHGKAYNIVTEDEPIAVADSSIEGLEIGVYERRPNSLFERSKEFFGLLSDYILCVYYEPGLEADAGEEAEAEFLTDNYFEFDRGDYQEVEKFLNEFSEDGYNTVLRAEDL